MKFIAMEPIADWHTNLLLKGNGDDVQDMPATTIQIPPNGAIHSVWFCRSLKARIMFLLFGRISFVAMTSQHPPVVIGIGNFMEKPDSGS